MTPRRTEIYQPSEPSAHNDLFGGDEVDLASHRLPRLIVGALLGLAALTTLIWFGYARSINRAGSEIVVIAPPPGPVRTRPEDAGGEKQIYSGLKVYGTPGPVEREAETSHLSPVRSRETFLASANPSSGNALPGSKAPVAEKQVSPEYLQIGSYPTQELAENAFRQFRIAHGDLAGVFLPDIKKAELGEKGVWYRLRIGPFAGMSAAAETCEKMKKEGVTCLITAR
jgi:SPOR domain